MANTIIKFNGNVVGEVMSNHSMTYEETLCLGIGIEDLESQEELEKLRENGAEYIYTDDEGLLAICVDDFEYVDEE